MAYFPNLNLATVSKRLVTFRLQSLPIGNWPLQTARSNRATQIANLELLVIS